MKSFIVLVLLFVISVSATTVYEEGVTGGSLLYIGNIGSKSAWETSWQSKIVRYPVNGEYIEPIGYLKITNNMDSSYSTATVKSGGVGSTHVQIEYYAPAYRGYDYNVVITGRFPTPPNLGIPTIF